MKLQLMIIVQNLTNGCRFPLCPLGVKYNVNFLTSRPTPLGGPWEEEYMGGGLSN
jgi:hypothetical protein